MLCVPSSPSSTTAHSRFLIDRALGQPFDLVYTYYLVDSRVRHFATIYMLYCYDLPFHAAFPHLYSDSSVRNLQFGY